MIARVIGARGQCAQAPAAIFAQTRSAIRVRNRGRCMTHELRSCQRKCHVAGLLPRVGLVRSARKHRLQAVDMAVQARIPAAGVREFREQCVDRRRFALRRALHVQAHDVARPFPDRIQRCFAIEPRKRALLDIAVATQALPWLRRRPSVRVCRSSISVQALPGARAPHPQCRRRRRRRGRVATRARSPLRSPARGRRARFASTVGRPAACRMRTDAMRDAAPARPRRGSDPRCRSRSRAAYGGPFR